jgi:hypothetical protein
VGTAAAAVRRAQPGEGSMRALSESEGGTLTTPLASQRHLMLWGSEIAVGIPVGLIPTGWPGAVARAPAPTERSVQISRTTLVRSCFTAWR